MKTYNRILVIIVFSQFCCTSLWFASNAVVSQLIESFNLENNVLGHLTSAVNFGFIIGTLFYAIFNLADKYAPSKVFFISAIIASLFNLACVLEKNTLFSLLICRFFVGFFLAGIYPVGMKIASDYKEKGLGKVLGFLVGALVLGTASPHILSTFNTVYSWELVFVLTTVLALFGGILMFCFVPDGPFRKPIFKTDFKAFFSVFKNRKLRKAAFGYFGHMWELYTFWAFVPVLITMFNAVSKNSNLNVSLWSFLIIVSGSLASVVAGYISQFKGVENTALWALRASCFCCIFSPVLFILQNNFVFIMFMCFWGMVVIADSALFSTLVANNAVSENKGTAMTIVTCIGFVISIISIQAISVLLDITHTNYLFVVLAIGPVLSLLYTFRSNLKLK